MVFQANLNQKKLELAKAISNEIDFNLKMVKGNKESQYIIIRWSVHQKDTYNYKCWGIIHWST